MIKLTNTLTRTKEEFKPLEEGKVGIYSCGPTVYNYAHIGNMRSYLLSDLVRRVFEYNGYETKQVINITDVGHLASDADEGEDKIERESKKTGRSAEEIAAFYTAAFFKDLRALDIKTDGTIFPKATDHIKEQIELAQTLESKGFAYRTSDSLYFDTARFPAYPQLAHLDLEGLKAGARIEANPEKRNPADFALWKLSPAGEKRQQEWDSPWGVGFPGWHIECSAMSMKYLGERFDIHTGGVDHIPVHHTNERAQSECATGQPFADYWLHGEFVMVDGQKMSKSLGNIYRLEDLKTRGFDPLAYRYWLLTAHYRSLVNFTWEALEAASVAFGKLQASVAELPRGGTPDPEYRERFLSAVNDDLNMPQAIALAWTLLKDASIDPKSKRSTLEDFDRIFGLGLASAETVEAPQEIVDLAAEREQARLAKDWEKADTFRQQISDAGYEVLDTENGPKIRKK